MADERKQAHEQSEEVHSPDLLEEFSIIELEERLEFESWCDADCQCGPPPP